MDKKVIMVNYVNPLIRFVKIKEKCNKNRDKNRIVFLFYRIIYQYYVTKYGIQIPCKTKIGKNFTIGHWGGIVVNPDAILGDYVHIMNGVLIGKEFRGKRKGTPIIGNKVWIGTNACIVGNIKIGNDVLIAPNALVNFDVPDNSIVLGNPASIIYKENATKDYIKMT